MPRLPNGHERKAKACRIEVDRLQSDARFKKESKRAKMRAKKAKFNSDKINFKLSSKLFSEIKKSDLSKMTKKQRFFFDSVKKVEKMSLKDAFTNNCCPNSQVVVSLFKILKKINSKRAEELAGTYKFRRPRK